MKEETCLGQSTTIEPFIRDDDTVPSTPTALQRGNKLLQIGKELLTESREQVWRRCKREEKLRYVDGLVPAQTAEQLRFGTLWHHGQEAWWKVFEQWGSEERLHRAFVALRCFATPETDAYELAKAEVMMEGYDARWGEERYEVLGVELEFRAPLINPETGAKSRTFERAGKLDVVVRHETGRAFVMEHKTSGEDIGQGSSFWTRLRMGGQSSGYIRGAEALEHQVDGVIYDVVRKPELRPLKATPIAEREYTKAKYRQCAECKKKNPAPWPHGDHDVSGNLVLCQDDPNGGEKRVFCTDPGGRLYANQRETDETVDEYKERLRAAIAEDPDKYYQRGLVVRLEAQLAEAEAERWLLSQDMREHHRLQLAPRNTDACQRYGSTCSYFSICAGEASADGDQFKRLEWAHPELTAPSERGG